MSLFKSMNRIKSEIFLGIKIKVYIFIRIKTYLTKKKKKYLTPVDYTYNTRTKFVDICNAALKGFKSKRDDAKAKHSGRHVHIVVLPPLIYAASLH